MRVRATKEGYFGLVYQYPADPDAEGSEADVFDIPDKPVHDSKRCRRCREVDSAPKAKDGEDKPEDCPKRGMPEAFSANWMEQAPAGTKMSLRNRRMAANGGADAFALAGAPRKPTTIGQDMIDGRKVI